MKTNLLLLCFVLMAAASNAVAQEKTKTMRSNTDPIKVGDIAPDFTLNDLDGNAVQLSKAKSPVVLVFYRGYW